MKEQELYSGKGAVIGRVNSIVDGKINATITDPETIRAIESGGHGMFKSTLLGFNAKPNNNNDVFKKGCFTPQPAVHNFSTQIKRG